VSVSRRRSRRAAYALPGSLALVQPRQFAPSGAGPLQIARPGSCRYSVGQIGQKLCGEKQLGSPSSATAAVMPADSPRKLWKCTTSGACSRSTEANTRTAAGSHTSRAGARSSRNGVGRLCTPTTRTPASSCSRTAYAPPPGSGGTAACTTVTACPRRASSCAIWRGRIVPPPPSAHPNIVIRMRTPRAA
jgi:hypothetical protein